MVIPVVTLLFCIAWLGVAAVIAKQAFEHMKNKHLYHGFALLFAMLLWIFMFGYTLLSNEVSLLYIIYTWWLL